MRRKRYQDVHSAGKSRVVPRLKNEDWKARHVRRKETALQNKAVVEQWCKSNGFRMDIKNGNEHWLFRTPSSKSVEWFPSTGKLIIGKNWKQGIHVHDVYQLMDILKVCKEDEK